jgi:hypothetical protein
MNRDFRFHLESGAIVYPSRRVRDTVKRFVIASTPDVPFQASSARNCPFCIMPIIVMSTGDNPELSHKSYMPLSGYTRVSAR